jgi:hypothetical protein
MAEILIIKEGGRKPEKKLSGRSKGQSHPARLGRRTWLWFSHLCVSGVLPHLLALPSIAFVCQCFHGHKTHCVAPLYLFMVLAASVEALNVDNYFIENF